MRRQWPSLILALVLAALFADFILNQEGPRQLANLAAHETTMQTENQHLREENAQLEVQVARLRTDDHYRQRLIRQELGYARPDEFVYRFRSDEGAQP